jgi:hypothetical protein
VRELVIVAADLQESRLPPVLTAAVPPALATLARFGAPERLPDGWRAHLARYLGRMDLAELPPATVAAAGVARIPADHVTAWVATPVHLIAGLTSVYMDAGSVLRLAPPQLQRVAADFDHAFAGTGFALTALEESDELMLSSAAQSSFDAGDPVTQLGKSLDQPAALERISAEIELWMHAHPLNAEREQSGERPVSTLWLWGCGPLAATPPVRAAAMPAGFGMDAWLAGLWRSAGQRVQRVPAAFAELSGSSAEVIVVVMQSRSAGQGALAPGRAFEELQQHWLGPALVALRAGALERLVLIADRTSLTLRAADLRKFWRRPRNPWQRRT